MSHTSNWIWPKFYTRGAVSVYRAIRAPRLDPTTYHTIESSSGGVGRPGGRAVGEKATYGAEAEGVDLDTKGGHVLLLELASQVALDESGLDPTNVLLAPLADQKFGAHFATTPQSIEGG